MKVSVHNRCSDFKSYAAARVKSLFNAESGCNFDLEAELPIDDADWRIGLIVGPSGSGKTSMGRQLGELWAPSWPADKPIIDVVSREDPNRFDDATGALAAVGLGSVPSWLRPYGVLSNGEKFRADMARLVMEQPERPVLDEFTSVVDRQIARVGALAFQKAWRRTGKQAVLLSCHYDIVEWLEPDWVFDTATGKYAGRGLWRRPKFDFEVWQTDWRYWPLFEPHHYLKVPRMIAATCYVATVDGAPVAHLAFSTRPGLREARACRMVVMPEWQGAGIGLRFLNHVCQLWLEGKNRFGRKMPTLFHTSHPGLCAALRRDSKRWAQTSAVLYGGNKRKSGASIAAANAKAGKGGAASGYGGHFRAVQGFRYLGERKAAASAAGA